MFFKSFENIRQIIIMAVLLYFSIMVILRIAGKRTLAGLNAFDWIVTVTIGSIASNTILSDDTKFLDGIAAILTITLLQYIISKLDVHTSFIRKALKSDPTLIYYDGEFLEENMKKMRITREDVLQEVRIQGNTVIDKVGAIILESNGKLSVIKTTNQSKIENLKKYD